MALFALTMAAPGTAHADFTCQFTGDDDYEMDSPGANGEGIFPAVNQWTDGTQAKSLSENTGMVTGAVNMPKDPEKYTMYELNGVRGLNWSGTQRGIEDASQTDSRWDASGADNCSIMDMVNNGIANMVFDGTKLLTRVAISIKEAASNPSPLSGLYEGRDTVVNTLKQNVFIPAVPVMVMLTGLWVFTKWRQQQMREVWSGVGWASLTTIAVVALLTGSNYDKVIREADSSIAQANAFLTEAALSGAGGTMEPPCDLPAGEKPNRGLRTSSCAMYDTLAFRPWALGQFGSGGTNCIFRKDGGEVVNGECKPADPGEDCYWGLGARCEDVRVRQLVSQSMTNKDVFPEKNRGDINKYKGEWYDVRQDMAGGEGANDAKKNQAIYPVAFEEWAGKNAGSRVGIAFYSLIAALIVGLMVIVLSALTLLWHAVTLILIILLPLIATLGIHPSQQKLLKGWLQTFIHSFVLRAGFGIILTVLLVLYQMILPARISLGMQLLMLLLVTVAVVMMLKKLIAGNFSPQIAGAADLGIGDMPGAVTGKAGSMIGAAGSTVKSTTGRVASAAGAEATRNFDKKVLGGRLQKGGWIGDSKRQQRKDGIEAREASRRQQRPDANPSQQGQGEAAPSGEGAPQQQAPRRTGRVSQGSTPPAAATAPTATPAPAPAPVPQQPEAPRPPRVQPPQQPVVQPPAQTQPPQLPPQQPPRDGNRMPR
ncbi:hypothetical protein ACGFYP_26560 [Streptomyces sp. NPDC048370]|uniref:hypothetical protein n=1 Tax=Streptomyces sp. NPDC048370 TaxID=3365540 RepID=UPI0037199A00